MSAATGASVTLTGWRGRAERRTFGDEAGRSPLWPARSRSAGDLIPRRCSSATAVRAAADNTMPFVVPLTARVPLAPTSIAIAPAAGHVFRLVQVQVQPPIPQRPQRAPRPITEDTPRYARLSARWPAAVLGCALSSARAQVAQSIS